MFKMNLPINFNSIGLSTYGKPTMPFQGRTPIIEKKIHDPSSGFPRGERYPIPSFFEYRIKFRDTNIK